MNVFFAEQKTCDSVSAGTKFRRNEVSPKLNNSTLLIPNSSLPLKGFYETRRAFFDKMLSGSVCNSSPEMPFPAELFSLRVSGDRDSRIF